MISITEYTDRFSRGGSLWSCFGVVPNKSAQESFLYMVENFNHSVAGVAETV